MSGRIAGHIAAGSGEAAEIALCAWRGFRGRCPRCGDGRLFGRYLKPAASCEGCGQVFAHHRADDFPPYIVMFVVGHLVGYALYVSETRYDGLPVWASAVFWPGIAIALSLALLQPVKGAVIGLQYGLGLHGFAGGPPRVGGGVG